MAEPLLTLSTLVERPVVVIDGERYELLNPAEMSVIDYHRMGRKGLRLEFIMGKDAPSDDEFAETKRLIDELCRTVLVAPGEVHQRLTDTARLAIIQGFMQLRDGGLGPRGPEVPSPIGGSA